TWMPMAGQTWFGAATWFVGMWTTMMVAMMLPSLLPILWRYRRAVSTGTTSPGWLTVLVGAGYCVVWTAWGIAAFPLGAAFASAEMQLAAVAHAVPVASGALVLIAGTLQFTPWKAHQLGCCRQGLGRGRTLPVSACTAWNHGLRLGWHCSCCCVG